MSATRAALFQGTRRTNDEKYYNSHLIQNPVSAGPDVEALGSAAVALEDATKTRAPPQLRGRGRC